MIGGYTRIFECLFGWIGSMAWLDAPFVIATMAFVLSLIVWKHGVDHNRLSVKPLITYSSLKDIGNQTIEVVFSNKGLGTAIFKHLRYAIGNQVYELPPDPTTFVQHLNIALQAADEEPFDTVKLDYSPIYEGHAIIAGGTTTLCKIDCSVSTNPSDTYEKIILALSTLVIYTEYMSLYGQEFKVRLLQKPGS